MAPNCIVVTRSPYTGIRCPLDARDSGVTCFESAKCGFGCDVPSKAEKASLISAHYSGSLSSHSATPFPFRGENVIRQGHETPWNQQGVIDCLKIEPSGRPFEFELCEKEGA